MSEYFSSRLVPSSSSYSYEIQSSPANFGSFNLGNNDLTSSVSQIAQDLLLLQGSGGALSGTSTTSASLSGSGSNNVYVSQVESAILNSTVPIDVHETEEITVLGQRGLWANRAEVASWRGAVPINEYQINEDANPEVITKRVAQSLEYVQELAIRYLRPPTPPPPGEIVIVQQGNTLSPPAPPLVIRQQPARPDTPEPLIVREAPPQPPASVGRKVITISGRRLPPPPRKVVIERLAPLPAKPQSVLIERWLPYAQVKRRVVFQRPAAPDPVAVRPRNVIVQWETPSVNLRKDIKYLGVVRANPAEYVQRYGSSLRVARDLPQFVLDIKTPDGLVLAADHVYNSVHELEGDVQALGLIDLEREGLNEYRSYLQRLGVLQSGSTVQSVPLFSSTPSISPGVIEQIFASIDTDGSGKISLEEAETIFLRLNSRLGRRYGLDEVTEFFRVLDSNNDGKLDLNEFKQAFSRLS